ncbi:MAG: hypothetical protein H0U76_07965 [Ktedonobacteraceae bacterium]|nr:hypothetical protein [Ktedonobacteraceae bacterium]
MNLTSRNSNRSLAATATAIMVAMQKPTVAPLLSSVQQSRTLIQNPLLTITPPPLTLKTTAPPSASVFRLEAALLAALVPIAKPYFLTRIFLSEEYG